MLPLANLTKATLIAGLVSSVALTGIIPCAVEMSKKHDDDKRSIKTYSPAEMQEYNALMSYFAEKYMMEKLPVYKCEALEQSGPVQIGDNQSLVTYTGNGGYGDWVVYKDKQHPEPRLYFITNRKCDNSCIRAAAVALEKLLHFTMKEVVSMTHGLMTVIGPDRFHDLLERASIEAITSAEKTGEMPNMQSVAQRMIGLANTSGLLLEHFACGSPNQVACPDHPIGSSVHGELSFEVDPLQNQAKTPAAIARDFVNETSLSTSLDLTALPFLKPTGHGPAVNHHPVSSQTQPATFVTATFTTTVAAAVATAAAVLGPTAAALSIGAFTSGLPALGM